ncbi:MAG: peptidoglycan-binding protein [Acidobacteria bacterium]|nr:MAG: peptidoglycan-binding protein [Acidobacteriota bacterium]
MSFLSFGNTGPAVSDLAQLVVHRGFLAASDAGPIFDRRLRQAIKDFQAQHLDSRGRPLVVDGIVGPLTLWALTHPDRPDLALPTPCISDPPPGGNGRGRAALNAALAEVTHGAREEGSNNSGPWVEKYLSGRASTPTNWCTAFVCWSFAQHPEPPPFSFTLGARGLRNTFKRRGWLIEPTAENPLHPGDLVFWWRDQPSSWKGHVGLVHHVANGILFTVEGNKGGFPAPVQVFDYVLARMERLLGFGRIPT